MSVYNADPWQVINNNNIEKEAKSSANIIEKFEDNFNPDKSSLEPLPDSANYLHSLEKKLQKVQKGAKLLDSLQEKKHDCMRQLLSANGVPESTLDQLLELDTPIESGRLHRHLLPVQANASDLDEPEVEFEAMRAQPSEDEGSEGYSEFTSGEVNSSDESRYSLYDDMSSEYDVDDDPDAYYPSELPF
ncbi:CG42557 [Drosophila busckii]|uniref:CG42557 n=1 Tax=Drosophila busckii TaxID=30019 RepID=A0A0M5J5I0_DROBS|nr:CG42557 [Drosophila busckii]